MAPLSAFLKLAANLEGAFMRLDARNCKSHDNAQTNEPLKRANIHKGTLRSNLNSTLPARQARAQVPTKLDNAPTQIRPVNDGATLADELTVHSLDSMARSLALPVCVCALNISFRQPHNAALKKTEARSFPVNTQTQTMAQQLAELLINSLLPSQLSTLHSLRLPPTPKFRLEAAFRA